MGSPTHEALDSIEEDHLNVPIASAPNAPTLELLPVSSNDVAEFIGFNSLEIGSRSGDWPPLLNLPIEIFRTIILYVLDDVGRYRYYMTMCGLQLVSRKWAEVIDDYPELWTKVHLDGPEKFVDMALSKSRGRTLDIECYGTTPSAARKTEAEAHRWRSLKLGTPGDGHTFSKLLSQTAPLLEELGVTSPLGVYLPILVLDGAVPNIRVIKISRCQLPWDSPSLSNLRKLVMHDVGPEPPTIGALLDILRRSPDLTHLHISSCIIRRFSSSPPQPVKLPRLRTLILSSLDPDNMNQLVHFMEVPPGGCCTLKVELENGIPLENQLAHMSKFLGALELIPLHFDPILLLKVSGGRFQRIRGADAELRFFTGEGSDTDLFLRVRAPPEKHVDILKYFVGQLRLSHRPWSPQLHLTNMFQPLHVTKTIELLVALSEALPNVKSITFADSTNVIEGMTDVLLRLFPQDSRTTPLFPRVTELTFQTSLHDQWVDSIVAMSAVSGQPGGVGHLPLDTLRLQRGSISAARRDRLQSVVPTLILDDVEAR